jgi:hypothetical protein
MRLTSSFPSLFPVPGPCARKSIHRLSQGGDLLRFSSFPAQPSPSNGRRPWSAAVLCGLAVALWSATAAWAAGSATTAAPSAQITSTSAAASNPGGKWKAQGPGPNTEGQVEGIEDGEVVGAIHTVAVHPTNAKKMFVGAVNGGIWKTNNATSKKVNWERLTDDQLSNSIGALEYDPTDPSRKTLVAGIGRFSSFSSTGGARIGLLRTTDEGKHWTVIDGGGVLIEKNISGVAARGNTLVVSVNTPNFFSAIGIWRSTDGGATFTQVGSGNGAATGLPGGITNDLVGDPNLPNRLFTGVVFADNLGGLNGVYRSNDTGASWTKVSSPAMDALIISGITNNLEFAVGRHNNVYAAIVNSGRLAGLFRSGDGGGTWTALDLPATNEGAPSGIHPGRQGFIHMSIAADPTNPNIVYVGGDRQPLFNEPIGGPTSFPNSIGANDFSGRIFRVDASKPPGSQAVHLTHSSSLGAAGGGTASISAPHADSREMAVDADGNLIETDDGGIYKRTNPKSNTGDWFSLNGDIQTTEMHDVSYDTFSDIVFGGDQDTGTPIQDRTNKVVHSSNLTADGGDVAVDVLTSPSFSTRFSSFQNLGAFNRTFWDEDNVFLGFDFPALLVVGGGPNPARQFITPVVVNEADGNRIVIGASNGIYESFDQGDTITRVPPGTGVTGTGVDPLAYGAADNPNALYVGLTDRVFIRPAAPPAPLVQSLTFPGTGTGLTVTDIAIDPDDGDTAFVSNTTSVYRTTDGGATWTNVTGNLQTLVPSTVRSLAFGATSRGDAIVVGSQNGVYFASDATGYTVWQRLGDDLPTVPVYDLDYDRDDDVLVAGTMGRGAWKLKDLRKAVHHVEGDDDDDDDEEED